MKMLLILNKISCYVQEGLIDGMSALIRQQAIALTNVDKDHWHHVVSLGCHELGGNKFIRIYVYLIPYRHFIKGRMVM